MEKNKVFIFVIIGFLSVTVIVMAATLFSTLNSLKEVTENNQNNIASKERVVSTEDISIFSISDPITANLIGDENNNKHILRISVGLGLDSTQKDFNKLNTELTEKTTLIRDIIIKVIRNKTYEEIQESNSQELIGDEILKDIQEEFQTNTIMDIYFGEFFVQ